MSLFKPYKITSANLDSLPIRNGQFIVCTDTKTYYLDDNNTRLNITPAGGSDNAIVKTAIDSQTISLNSSSARTPLILKSSLTDNTYIGFKNGSSDNYMGYFGVTSDHKPIFNNITNDSELLTEFSGTRQSTISYYIINSGWYRIGLFGSESTNGKAYLISITNAYYNHGPSTITALFSISYGNASIKIISQNSFKYQEQMPNIQGVSKLGWIKYNNSQMLLDMYVNATGSGGDATPFTISVMELFQNVPTHTYSLYTTATEERAVEAITESTTLITNIGDIIALKADTDERTINTIPNNYNGVFKVSGLKESNVLGIDASVNGLYSCVIGARGWGDSSGGDSHEFALAGSNGAIWHRFGSTTSWSEWYDILDGRSGIRKDSADSQQIYSSSGDTALYLRSGSANSYIGFRGSANTDLGFFGFSSAGKPIAASSAIGSSKELALKTDIPTYADATTSAHGLMTAAMVTKLNGIATGATAVSESTVSGWGFTKNAGTITGSGTSGYIAKWNGASSITNGPAFGSSTTTFLRNDGAWAAVSATWNGGQITGMGITNSTSAAENGWKVKKDNVIQASFECGCQSSKTGILSLWNNGANDDWTLWKANSAASGAAADSTRWWFKGQFCTARMQCGSVSYPATSTPAPITVTFGTNSAYGGGFANVPKVVATCDVSGYAVSVNAVSKTQMQIYPGGLKAAATIYWIAYDPTF